MDERTCVKNIDGLGKIRACAGVFDVSAADLYINTILTELLKPGFSSRASADLTLAYGLTWL